MAVRRPARRVGSHPGCVAGHVDGIPGRCRPLRNKPRSAARRGPYRWTACPVADGDRRFGHRLYQETLSAWTTTPQSRTLVIRAGRAGQRLARELLFTPALGYRPVCFVDDDPEKRGQRVHGLMVTGTRNDLQRLVRQFRIDVIVFAILSLSAEERRSILARCEDTPARIKIVPGLPELLTGRLNGVLFRDARLEDLLGRPPVSFQHRAEVRSSLAESVLITGAAGSIGSELARQVAATGPGHLVLLDTNESGLFDLAAELQAADARDMIGTLTLCMAAEASRCERVVFISTDKAVAPASVMGATKRVGEHVIRAFSEDSRTIFCAVRFGNVLGSVGVWCRHSHVRSGRAGRSPSPTPTRLASS